MNRNETTMKKIKNAMLAMSLLVGASAGAAIGTTTARAATYDPAYVSDQCRENGPGRIHAINDLWAYKTTWDQPEADAIVADVNRFIAVCNGALGTGNIIKTGKKVKACFADWAGYLPFNGACYAPWDGNVINYYNSALLKSSR
jgi:hypothetical protein